VIFLFFSVNLITDESEKIHQTKNQENNTMKFKTTKIIALAVFMLAIFATNSFADSIVYPTFTVTSADFPSDASGFNLTQGTFNNEPVALINYQTSGAQSFTERYFYIGLPNRKDVPVHPSGYTTLKKYNCIVTEGIKYKNYPTQNYTDENGVLIGGLLYAGRICLWEYIP
jgi:hypothetical protein